jgi:CBS domain containing-hemolysin-like protein
LIALLALALLLVLMAVNWLIIAFTARYPAKARAWVGPLQRTAPAGSDRRSGNGHSNISINGSSGVPTDEEQWELEEQVIAAAEFGGIDARDREMLRSILRLDVSTVREIMMPRLDMVTVDVNSSLLEVAVSMCQNGHSRLPVFEESIDTIVGIVHSRDLLAILGRGESDKALREAMRPAFFIPESKRLDDLLEELQEKGVQMAIVVDEYGGTEGLVTMEDLLEEIVGEIEDEFSRDLEPEVVRYPDGSALVDAGVTTDEVRALFGAVLDSTDIDTVGGYVYRSLGRIPQAGDIVVTEKLRIEVVSIFGRRLRKLRINPIVGEATAQKAS